MEKHKHLPLNKPPKASSEKVLTPIPTTPIITQQRMATLNLYNKLFFIFGLLALTFGIYTSLGWKKDSRELDRYNSIFKGFPKKSTISIKNSTSATLFMTDFNVSYLLNSEDSIRYYGEKFDPSLKLESGATHDFSIPKDKKTDEQQLLFYGILCWETAEGTIFLSRTVPENGYILLD